jgi:hypothetical protein
VLTDIRIFLDAQIHEFREKEGNSKAQILTKESDLENVSDIARNG